MRVGEAMSRDPAQIEPTATLGEAARLIGTSGVSDLMVVDADGRFHGVLSEGDVLRVLLPDRDQVLAAGATLADAFRELARMGAAMSGRPIDPLVIDEPLVVAPDDDVGVAILAMVDRHIRRLPVVADGRLVGTISRTDVCRIVVGG